MEILEALPPDLTGAESRTLAEAIVRVMDARKAADIRLMHVEAQTVLTEYFVLATGHSSTQVKALAGEIEYRLGQSGVNPDHVEGVDGASWILMDYGPVIVHIFTDETRRFYNLEKLWADAGEEDITALLTD